MTLEDYKRCGYHKQPSYKLLYRGRFGRGLFTFRYWLIMTDKGNCHGTLDIFDKLDKLVGKG